jgi:transposase
VPSRAQQQPLAEDILKTLQARLPRTDLIVVADSKGASHAIVGKYRQAKAHFVSPLKPTVQQAKRLAAVPFEQFEPLEYSTVRGPQEIYRCHVTTLVLCPNKCKQPILVNALFMHSTGKQRRDEKTRHRQLDKGYQRLEEISGHLNKGQYFHAEYARKQLAKAVPKDARDIVHCTLEGEDGKLSLRRWSDWDAYRKAAECDGRYILIYDLPEDRQPNDAFYLYKRQYLVEARHRGLKSDLEVNPVWLKNENRVLALVFVFILALIVFSLLGLCSERAGLRTERYPKMTARELLCRFGGILMGIAQIRDGPTFSEINLSIEQAYLLHELNFPDPGSFLPNLNPDQTVGANE